MGVWFETNGLAELAGGSSYILKLSDTTPSAANIVAYAEIVKEKSRLRQLIDLGTSLTGEAFENRESSAIASTAASRIGAMVGDVRAGGLAKASIAAQEFLALMHERYELHAELTGLQTPWKCLNELLFGWQPELYFIAGRPNAGKTLAGVQAAAFNALILEKATAFFSLEMAKRQIIGRIVSCYGKIQHRDLRNPAQMPEAFWPSVTGTIARISQSKLTIDDTARLTADQIVARATRQHMREPLSLIVIDHFHEMKFQQNGSARVDEMGDECRKLKKLAKDLGIPVILLLQLKRPDDESRRPTMKELRGSGALEEVGDTILFLNKPHGKRDVIELIVGKAREAESGAVYTMQNSYHEMRLDDWEGAEPTEDEPASRPRGLGRRSKLNTHTTEVD
jgi:replicative DNA helicase